MDTCNWTALTICFSGWLRSYVPLEEMDKSIEPTPHQNLFIYIIRLPTKLSTFVKHCRNLMEESQF